MLLPHLESSIRSYIISITNLDKLIIRYNDHSSILAIKNKCTELNSNFTYKKVDKEQISIAIKRLYLKKFQNPTTYDSELSRNLVTLSGASLLKISMNAWAKIFSQMN